ANVLITSACTCAIPKTFNRLWNQDFFRIVLSKHRLVFKIYNQNKLVKDEFLGMVFVDLNLNISYESAEQSIVLQHVRDIATIGLVYINPGITLLRSGSFETDNNEQNESGFEIIHHCDLSESITEPLLQSE
ncbi:unnamed protein product, partial [Rotaria sordida]